MKKRIKTVLTCISFMIAIQTWGQQVTINRGLLNENSNRMKGKLTGDVFINTYQSNNKFFLHENWIKGSITLQDGDVYENQKLRYKAFGDELVVFNSNIRKLFIVDKEKVSRFTLKHETGNMHFIRLYFDGLISGYRYFEQLHRGANRLLVFHSIREEKTNPYLDKHGKMKDTRFELRRTYFLYSEDTGFYKLKPHRRSFLRLYPDNKRQIRQIFRKNNIRNFDQMNMGRAVQLLEEAGFTK